MKGYFRNDLYLLGDFEPGLLETEDGASVERGCDFQHGVVVVQAAADVSHCHPFLNHCHTYVDIIPVQDLCGYSITDLTKKRKTHMVVRAVLLAFYLTVYLSRVNTYIVEMLGCSHNIRRFLILVVLHPALTKELPVEKKGF